MGARVDQKTWVRELTWRKLNILGCVNGDLGGGGVGFGGKL